MKGKVFLKHLLGIVPFLLFGGLSLYFFVFSTPEKIADVVGVTNGYVFISILAFLGGLTTFSGIPYHLILVTLSLGGLYIAGGIAAKNIPLFENPEFNRDKTVTFQR